MEEGVLPQNTIWGPSCESLMDMDYMDELLLEGCWLETYGTEFSPYEASTPISPFEPSFVWPSLDPNDIESGWIPSKDGMDKPSLSENSPMSQSQASNTHVENTTGASNPSFRTENYSIEGSESSQKWWIGPRASTSVMDRLIQAIGYIKEFSRDKDILIQVWVPVTSCGGKRVLTTNHQPFSLDLNCPGLAHYRDASINFQFPAEEDSKEVVGLPGRVFRSKVPEWTPDVRFFTPDEYPRVGHARKYDICGSIAVPVLERGTRNCLGVIEVVLTKQKIKYRPDLESVCKALEAVDLKSSEVSDARNIETCDFSYQAALPEILTVLESACGTYGLPLAQTWVSCILQGKGGCRHSEENLENCVSTIDSACYVGDPQIRGFHDACSEHHLLKGQGVVGKAFGTNQPCFSPDVTSCCKTEYPLSHHARMFGLHAAVAIRLRSVSAGSADFVLEFFLPVDCRDPGEQRKMLNSLSDLIQSVSRSLRVVTDEELLEKRAFSDKKANENPPVMRSSTEVVTPEKKPFPISYSDQVENQASSATFSFCRDGKSGEMFGQTSEVRPAQPAGEKKGLKSEKKISLQVLRQHFAGSLKDAAKNLGVCPTTLKRICRQQGIQRWPSRKLKKVGHSLQKIKRVMDSVQGQSGALPIESFYSNFPKLISPNPSKPSPPAQAAASISPSSSCSHSSGSSQCCSSGTHRPNSYSVARPEESAHSTMKKARSGSNLQFLSYESNPIPRSRSHVSFHETAGLGNSPPETRDRCGPRIKASFGEEKIRFRMQNGWGYCRLMREICRRFGVDESSRVGHLKYLDDDSEWVLLTCDADLDECLDVCRLSHGNTIRLVLLCDSRPGSNNAVVSGEKSGTWP